MDVLYCPNCQKKSGFKRALGVGTIIMIVLTCGFWLLLVPLYPARCINCGTTRGSAMIQNTVTALSSTQENSESSSGWGTWVAVIAIIGLVVFLFVVMGNR